MRTVIVSGSQNLGSASRRVADYLFARCESLGFSAAIHDLSEAQIPFFSDEAQHRVDDSGVGFATISATLAAADSLIVITPEWSGMATPAIKNFFLWCTPEILAHKPALIVSVSSGDGGAYPIVELRASSYKNTRVCYLPDHIIVRYVDDVFPARGGTSVITSRLGQRIDYTLRILNEYSTALRLVRSSGAIETNEFRYGM